MLVNTDCSMPVLVLQYTIFSSTVFVRGQPTFGSQYRALSECQFKTYIFDLVVTIYPQSIFIISLLLKKYIHRRNLKYSTIP